MKSVESNSHSIVSPPRQPRRRPVRKQGVGHALLRIIAGYTVLVVDTNILLSSLPMLSSLIESQRWTVVVPLPVIMELDGLSANSGTQLGDAARDALTYLSSHVRSHSISLKIQTSKGNYLPNLNVRREHVDFDKDGNWERNMDDLILKAAIWHDEHWVDRSGVLHHHGVSTPSGNELAGAVKVVLLSLDRNCTSHVPVPLFLV